MGITKLILQYELLSIRIIHFFRVSHWILCSECLKNITRYFQQNVPRYFMVIRSNKSNMSDQTKYNGAVLFCLKFFLQFLYAVLFSAIFCK